MNHHKSIEKDTSGIKTKRARTSNIGTYMKKDTNIQSHTATTHLRTVQNEKYEMQKRKKQKKQKKTTIVRDDNKNEPRTSNTYIHPSVRTPKHRKNKPKQKHNNEESGLTKL